MHRMHRRWSHLLLAALPALLTGPALAAPSLTDAQHQQLQTARDHGPLDEGALYALLAAAVDWTCGDDQGARVPSYPSILADPVTARGDLFLLEGAFVAADELHLARKGPWGGAVSYWVIKYGDVDAPDGNNVAVVLMVDPDGKPGQPSAPRQPVRIPAVFYKVWRSAERTTGQPTDFPTFVARAGDLGALLDGPPPGRARANIRPGGGAMVPTTWPMILLVLVALAAAWFLLRRTLRSLRLAASPTVRRARAEHAAPDEPAAELEIRDDLPRDPAAAMGVLEAEHAATLTGPSPEPADPASALSQMRTQAPADPPDSTATAG